MKDNASDKKPSKWRSTKWWVTVWAMCLTTFIIVTGKSEFAPVLMMLAGVPVAYIGANVVQKKIYSNSERFDTSPIGGTHQPRKEE